MQDAVFASPKGGVGETLSGGLMPGRVYRQGPDNLVYSREDHFMMRRACGGALDGSRSRPRGP